MIINVPVIRGINKVLQTKRGKTLLRNINVFAIHRMALHSVVLKHRWRQETWSHIVVQFCIEDAI